MIATITSAGVFAVNYAVAQAPPVRMRPEGVAVTIGRSSTVTPGAAEPMVEVSLSQAGQAPVAFWMVRSGERALAAWAKPSS